MNSKSKTAPKRKIIPKNQDDPKNEADPEYEDDQKIKNEDGFTFKITFLIFDKSLAILCSYMLSIIYRPLLFLTLIYYELRLSIMYYMN